MESSAGTRSRSQGGAASRQQALQKCFIKIVAIGDSGVGKTSLIQMFENAKFTESFKPTIGADFSNKEIRTSNGRLVTLQIWDTAG
jgi:Ras-related protein Rab-7A